MFIEPIMEISEPEVYTSKNVMFWEPHSKELLELKKEGKEQTGTLLSKARKFIENGCIRREGAHFICKPLQNYNSTQYLIKNTEKGLVCDCQGCQTKLKHLEKPFCCHILAVYQYCFLEEHNG